MTLTTRIRKFLIERTSVPEAAFIYETENFTLTEEIPYVVKEWSLATSLSRFTDEVKSKVKMLEYDLMQATDLEDDIITEPAEEIASALQDYVDEDVWDTQVEISHPEKGRISLIATLKIINR